MLLVPLAAVAAVAVMAGPAAASGAENTRGMTSRASPARPVIAYVTGGSDTATVTPIRTATNTALPPIKVGNANELLETIVVTPDGTTVYVVNELANTVTPIRTATNTALPPVKVGSLPVAIAITP
ncbi:MAG TPA: hypothetical protein VGS19_38290 [Streptosporangiaceae bacterium]|nr:hypothetical protein [Streptosporangiaceae bacterium]